MHFSVSMQNDINVRVPNRQYVALPIRIFEIIIAIYLVLEITNVTRYIFFIRTGVIDRVMSVGIIIVMLGGFILINLTTAFRVLGNKAVLFWFLMTLVLPVMSLLLIPQECGFRDYLRLILYAEISMFGMILAFRGSYKMLGIIFLGILTLAILNCLISRIFPHAFYGFAEVQFAKSYGVFVSGENIVRDRATGLFNSNVLGCLLNTSFICFLCFYKGKTIIPYVLITIMTGFSVFLTGSRGAVLFFLLICVMYFIYLLKNGQYLASGRRSLFSAYIGYLFILSM